MGSRPCPEKCTCKRHHRCVCEAKGENKCPHHNPKTREKQSKAAKKNPRGFALWPKEKLRAFCRTTGGTQKLRPSRVRKMSEIERAWLGAFIEADGCAFILRKPKCQDRIILNITQKEIDPIATALRLTQTGVIQFRNQVEIWSWITTRLNDALDITTQCAPYSWKLQRVLADYKQEV